MSERRARCRAMAKKPRCSLSVEISPAMQHYLQQLVATGLYGTSIVDCAEQLLREQLREVMAKRHKAGLDVRLGEARTCRVCGCTDAMACPSGCSWVDEDLCSACVKPGRKSRG